MLSGWRRCQRRSCAATRLSMFRRRLVSGETGRRLLREDDLELARRRLEESPSFEARVVPQHGIEIEWIGIAGVRGRGIFAWVAAPFRVLAAIVEALRASPDAALVSAFDLGIVALHRGGGDHHGGIAQVGQFVLVEGLRREEPVRTEVIPTGGGAVVVPEPAGTSVRPGCAVESAPASSRSLASAVSCASES